MMDSEELAVALVRADEGRHLLLELISNRMINRATKSYRIAGFTAKCRTLPRYADCSLIKTRNWEWERIYPHPGPLPKCEEERRRRPAG